MSSVNSKNIDIQEMIERDKRRREAQADEKVREKLKRQIYIFNKEKESFTRKTQHEINKQRRSLELLETEKMTELENYLSMRSRTTELLYKKQECIVRDLVKTSDTVRELLEKEKQETLSLGSKCDGLKKDTWDVKRNMAKMHTEHEKFRIPDQMKMDKRVEHASGKFHRQLVKNKEIEKNIDDAVKLRELYMREETKLKGEVDKVVEMIQALLIQTSEIYERRDRAENTKIKVKDHLNKVKDRYERELLSISLQLSEDKKMETFMRTKHKDITQYLRQLREKEIQDADKMMRTKDEFTKAFDEIKRATGKTDMNVIVHDFIEAEEGNLAIFHNIGELLDSNEALRGEISRSRDANVIMEDDQLVIEDVTLNDIKATERRIKEYTRKSERSMERITDNQNILIEYADDINDIVSLLKIDKLSLAECFDKNGQITDRGLPDVMTAIEREMALLLKDFYMVELATRAIKTNESQVTDNEEMLCRVPSARILPHDPPKPSKVNLLKDKDDVEEMSVPQALEHKDVKDKVVKNMLTTMKSSVADIAATHLSYALPVGSFGHAGTSPSKMSTGNQPKKDDDSSMVSSKAP